MENYTDMKRNQEIIRKPTESSLYQDLEKNIIKSLPVENNTTSQTVTSSSSSVLSVNSTKAVISEALSVNSQQASSNFNDNGKYIPRRNPVQPNLLPLMKKPNNNISTTKPLILPAPISDSSFSQGTKTNIVTMHSNYSTSSISSQFNTCQQQMSMGIATIQPQHFGYSGISSNRYPMIPISLQNSYSGQQLTLANGSLGTAVQLMPVMNQNNNQMNNSRVQSLPIFMAPIIGAPSGMLFQPNMTLMPQSSNAVQTINLPNCSAYSSDCNASLGSIQSQTPVYAAGAIRNTTTLLTTTSSTTTTPSTDVENVALKQVNETNNKLPQQNSNSSTTATAVVLHTQNGENSDLVVINSKINKAQTGIESVTSIRTNVKHRELIRTQIYRMKPAIEEVLPVVTIKSSNTALLPEEPSVTSVELPTSPIVPESTVLLSNEVLDPQLESEKDTEINEDDNKSREEEKLVISVESPVLKDKPLGNLSGLDNVASKQVIPPEVKPVSPVPLHVKRKLPSPEILDKIENPKKLFKACNIPERPDSTDQKSPSSLFEKLCKGGGIPQKQNSMFSQNHVNGASRSTRLTAIVRPEQRKILVHYLDDLIVFESDEPFPTSNKMQMVKSALKAGNITLNSQKSKVFPDHFLYTNNTTDDEMSPNYQKQNPIKTYSTTTTTTTTTTSSSNSCSSSSSNDTSTTVTVASNYHTSKGRSNQIASVKPDTCLEPLSIDIPTTTTNTVSSCGSIDSSQVRPLSVCSHHSPAAAPILVKKASKEIVSPKKDLISPVKDGRVKYPPKEIKSHIVTEPVEQPIVMKEQIPVKQVSPVKQQSPKNGLDRPICEWSVSDVAEFVKQTPGCDNYVAIFQNHEIDGEALLLLSNDNLIQGALNMKIGPALKLCARIEKRKALDPPQH